MASPDKKAFLLRVDPALWAQVEALAAQELRSANAQVEYLLREALARRGRATRAAGTGAAGAAAGDEPKAPAARPAAASRGSAR